MAGNLSPQQFGPFIDERMLHALGIMSAHAGGSSASVTPGHFQKSEIRALKTPAIQSWKSYAEKTGYGHPN